jgi:hypothetical protein
MHASIKATLYNAHFETNKVPWLPSDFLGTTDRGDRMREHQRDRMMAFKFSGIMTDNPDLLPEWMTGPAFKRAS